MSRVLVLGGTGVIGSRLSRLLSADGHQVWATTRSPGRLDAVYAAGAKGVVADALDRASIDAALAEARPDVVVHAFTDLSGLDWAANARLRTEGTRNLVEACLAVGVETMVAQSIGWASVPGDGPADETTPADPSAFAPVASLESDVARMPHGVILRLGILYGSGTFYAPDGVAAADARAGVVRPTTRVTDWLHADDAAEAFRQALTWPTGPVFVVDDVPSTADEWAPVFADRVGGRVDTIADAPPGRQASRRLATERGWRPSHPDWRDGLGFA